VKKQPQEVGGSTVVATSGRYGSQRVYAFIPSTVGSVYPMSSG